MRIPNFDHCAVKQDPASSSFANAAIRKQFYFFGKGVTPPTRRVACITRMSLHCIYTGRTSYMYPHVGSVVYLVLSALCCVTSRGLDFNNLEARVWENLKHETRSAVSAFDLTELNPDGVSRNVHKYVNGVNFIPFIVNQSNNTIF
jgi:hypothetical protein